VEGCALIRTIFPNYRWDQGCALIKMNTVLIKVIGTHDLLICY